MAAACQKKYSRFKAAMYLKHIFSGLSWFAPAAVVLASARLMLPMAGPGNVCQANAHHSVKRHAVATVT